MVNQIQGNTITEALYLPAVRQDMKNSQDTAEIIISNSKENIKLKSPSQGSDNQEEKVFEEIEKNAILFKVNSNKRKYLTEKITSLIKEYAQSEDTADNEPQKKSINSENTKNSNTQDKEEPPFEELKQNIDNNINKGFLRKLIDKHQDIIVSITNASQEVANFFQKVASNLTSIPPEQKIKNVTSLKGLMFDMLL